MEVFAAPILNECSENADEPIVRAAEKVLVSASDVIGRSWKKLLWDASYVLCPTQSYHMHITQYFSNHFRDPMLYEMIRHFRYHNSHKSGKGGYIQCTLTLLQSVDCTRAGVP